MLDQNKHSVLRYVLPSFSEFEFIFFTSLVTCSLLAFIIRQAAQIHSFLLRESISTSAPLILGFLLVAAIFVGSLIQMSMTATRQPLAFWDDESRARYIMLPTFIVMLIGTVQLLETGFSKSQSFGAVTLVMVILLLRYAVIAMIVSFIRYSDWLNERVAVLFCNYQVAKSEAMAAIVLGLIGAIIVSISAQLATLVIVDSVGRLLIQSYRGIRAS
jgi:hypothetical protein